MRMRKLEIDEEIVLQKDDSYMVVKRKEDGYYMLMGVEKAYFHEDWEHITLDESVIERDIDRYWTDIDTVEFIRKLRAGEVHV